MPAQGVNAEVALPEQAHVAPERATETLQLSPRIEARVRQHDGGREGRSVTIEDARRDDVGLHGADGRTGGGRNGEQDQAEDAEQNRRDDDTKRLSPILHRNPPSHSGTSATPVPIRKIPSIEGSTVNNGTLTSNNGPNNGPPIPRSPNPEFAELLTPAKLRRRKRHIPRVTLPAAIAGPSREGWQTGEDVYRGAINDPTILPDQPIPIDDEAISLGGSSSSSSSGSSGSTWSIVSDLERGRRRTVAAIERFGERIGVRRASSASSDHSVGSILERQQQELRHKTSRRMSQRLTRNLTLTRSRSRRSSIDSSHSNAPRRQYIPRKRQFTLLVNGETTTTPNLATVLAKVRELRVQAGLEAPVPSRGGSGQGRKRMARPVMPRGKTSFVPPPKPVRPLGRLGTQSRLSALRAGAGASPTASPPITPLATPTGAILGNGMGPRPLTPAELMGLTSPASAPNLTSLREFPSNTITDPQSKRSSLEALALPSSANGSGTPSPPSTAAFLPAKPKVTWWLDVGCPTWEDLRDIGELLSLHPLTLEDVLQQDPREKMDVFDPLGYYFIVVRALDETYFKYTPGSSSVTSVGKSPVPASAAASATARAPASQFSSPRDLGATSKTEEGGGEKGDLDEKGGNSTGASPDLAAQHAKKEGRRRGWGMGRAVGKLAGRQGEKVEIVEDNPGKEGLEGVGVGAVNVYMAVFDDGIITFHFDDISKHTNRVRERVLSGAQQNTADGLAHGILDSVVDAFFPLVRYVDGEVDDLDSLTIDPTVLPRSHARRRADTLQHPTGSSAADVSGSNGSSPAQRAGAIDSAAPSPEGFAGPADADGSGRATAVGSRAAGSAKSSYNDEKQRYPPRTLGLRERLAPRRIFPFVRPTRSSPDLPVSSADPYAYPSEEISRISFRRRISSCLPAIHINVPAHHWGLTYIRLFFLPVSSAVRQHPRPMRPAVDRNELLQRIVEVRRIVTGMTRMLGAKHQVVGRLRKRMEDGDLNEAAYVGDVEDHILLLQTSLYHYEYILAHCQPAYLSHVRWSYNITRRLISKKILVLSTVTVTILPLQTVTGIFSMNVRIPRNGDAEHFLPDGVTRAGFSWFGAIVAIVFTVICVMCGLVRYWRWTARMRYDRHKGKDLPDWWEGFWGWK